MEEELPYVLLRVARVGEVPNKHLSLYLPTMVILFGEYALQKEVKVGNLPLKGSIVSFDVVDTLCDCTNSLSDIVFIN